MADIVAYRWRFKSQGPNAPWIYTTEILQPEAYKEIQALALADAWQPIETAPKDGTMITVSNGAAVFTAWWENNGWIDGETNCFGDSVTYDPTHWQPSPAPPVAGGANG